MGVARLEKVTIISPRSEYAEVATSLAKFEDFHPMEGAAQSFDPSVQELTVKAVRLFAQADQAVKDLGLQLMPGQIDVVFRGVRIPRSEFKASSWKGLLDEAERELGPIVVEVKNRKATLQKAQKDEGDLEALIGALKVVSGFSADLGGLGGLKIFKAVVTISANDRLGEFRNSLPGSIFLTEPLDDGQALVLVVVDRIEETKLDKAMKFLELKPLILPSEFPQNPSESFKRAVEDHRSAIESRQKAEASMAESKKRHGDSLLTLRELTEVARKTLDEARVSGGMKRMAMISGYIPARREIEFRQVFGKWMVHAEEPGHEDDSVPTLMTNRGGLNIFQTITKEQGIPGKGEVDPTPVVSFVFPVFFGMMFGDVAHGLILTGFMLVVRQRGTANMRTWANLFIVTGISSVIFGAIFGEFFELSFYSVSGIPALIEIIHRVAGTPDVFSIAGVYAVMEISILIGIAHLTTGLCLDVYESAKDGGRLELWLEKIPVLTMYISGVGFGLAFVGVGYSFDKLGSTAPAPLLGIPIDILGEFSIAILVVSMLVLLAGKALAIEAGKMAGSVLGALTNGGLEVFERISQFMSNSISYVRLAVMLLVHAALLLITNQYFGPSGSLTIGGIHFIWPELVPIWIILNLLILSFEAFIVYVQDLRLHLYEFFTKFYLGTGAPFRKIFPDRVRISVDWV